MCRNIKTLYNFEPPATDEEIRAAALQYVRKISGSTNPSAANREAFDRAVDEVARASATLLGALVTSAAPKDREVEAARARERAVRRFGAQSARSAARGAMKVHLVDGTYELFRSHFGAPPRQDADGREVGATVGLLRSLWLLLSTPGVTHVACAFDHVIESFRNDLYAGYKTSAGVDPAPAGPVRAGRGGGAGARPGRLADGGVRGGRRARHGRRAIPRPAGRRPGRALFARQGPRAGGGRRRASCAGTGAGTSSWTRPA